CRATYTRQLPGVPQPSAVRVNVSIDAGPGDPLLSLGLTRLLKSSSPVLRSIIGSIISSFGEPKRLTYALLALGTKTISWALVPVPTDSVPFVGVMKPSCGSRI